MQSKVHREDRVTLHSTEKNHEEEGDNNHSKCTAYVKGLGVRGMAE